MRTKVTTMTPEREKDLADLLTALKPLEDEQVAQNVRYNFAPASQRMPEDNARFKEIIEAQNALKDAYEAKYPLPPCELCGAKRSSYMDDRWPSRYTCHNIARCKNAPRVMGG